MNTSDFHVVEIDPAEVWERIRKGEQLNIVDVRTEEELLAGKIPQAKHIPLDQLPYRYRDIDPAAETVIVCRSGYRSGMACAFLAQLGFRNVKNMAGGMLAWEGDVETDQW